MSLRMGGTYNNPGVKKKNKELLKSTQQREVTLNIAKRDINVFQVTGLGIIFIGVILPTLCTFLGLGLSIAGATGIGHFFFMAPYAIAFSSLNLYYYWYGTSRISEKNIKKRLKAEGPDAIYVRTFLNTPNDFGTILLFSIGVWLGVLLALVP